MYTSIANHGLTLKDKLIENYYILNQIVQSIDTGIAIFYEKKLVHVNNELRRITGRTYKYLENNLIDIISPTDYYNVKRNYVGVLKRYYDKSDFYFNIKMPDGSTKRLRCKFIVIRIVEKKGVFAMIHEAPKSADDLQSFHNEEIAANVAHELRSPLNAIIGFSNILADDNITTADHNLYLTYIRNSCLSLLHLLDDFADFNKLEHRKIQIDESVFDINKLFDELEIRCKIFCSSNNKTNLTINKIKAIPDSECLVSGDSQRITQILINLLTNAIKFTENGSVTYSYTIDNGILELSVKDTGIGIPPDMISKVFRRFTQVGTLKSNNGLGLGLSITKSLVELMKGTIDVTSEVGVGSEFIIRLPQKNLNRDKVSQKSGQKLEYDFTGKTILIAEDARINYILLEKILAKSGASILWAQNGEECVEKFKNNRSVNLILMDMQMPVMDGYAAAREILKIDPKMPIIAQTAFSMDDERERILNTGCADYIAKPIDRCELLSKIAAVIR